MLVKIMKNSLQIDDLPFTKTEPVILALSGGIDSMVLFNYLINNNYNVVICHVNHGKREASQLEEKYIKEMCINLKVKCEISHFKTNNKQNFQDEAHTYRYNFFYDTAIKYNASYILTAHQANDLAETCLLRLITGSNLYGYGGISKEVNYKDIKIYRPLLNISRDSINEYARNNNVVYFEDESNATDDYLRNRIRHNILPLFIKENPNFLNSIYNYSLILKDSFNYIRNNTIKFLNNKLEFKVSEFIVLDLALQKDIICYILENYNIKPSSSVIADLLNIIKSDKPQLNYNLKNNYIFSKRYDLIYVKKNDEISYEEINLNIEEKKIFLGKYIFYLTKNLSLSNAKYLKLWYNETDLPLRIRTRLPGDFLNFKFGKKKVKDYFIDKKIIKEKRDTYPIILNNKNEIIAIYDLINLSKGDKFIYLICEVKDA